MVLMTLLALQADAVHEGGMLHEFLDPTPSALEAAMRLDAVDERPWSGLEGVQLIDDVMWLD